MVAYGYQVSKKLIKLNLDVSSVRFNFRNFRLKVENCDLFSFVSSWLFNQYFSICFSVSCLWRWTRLLVNVLIYRLNIYQSGGRKKNLTQDETRFNGRICLKIRMIKLTTPLSYSNTPNDQFDFRTGSASYFVIEDSSLYYPVLSILTVSAKKESEFRVA